MQGRSLTQTTFENCTINCLTFEENTRQPFNDKLCLFCAPPLHFHGNKRLKEEMSNFLNLFMSRMDRLSPSQFHGVHINNILFVEDLLLRNLLLKDMDIVEGNFLSLLDWRSVQKHENTVRLLRYNNLICYVSNLNAFFESFRCPNCDTFVNRTSNWERNLTRCSELSLTSWTLF